MTCSNCAGTLEGIDAFGSSEVPDFAPTRSVMNEVGEIYLALRRKFGDGAEIDVVDPRNAVYLIPALLRDYRRFRPPLGVFLKTLLFGISPASVIVNGRALYVGDLPTPEDLIKELGSLVSDELTN